jgi:hypothetical protein
VRITIDIDGTPVSGDEGSGTTSISGAEALEAAVPPPDVAARAAAQGAISAGPAPSDATAEGPAVFLPTTPGTPETAPTDSPAALAGQSAGAAPALLTGATLDEVDVEVDSGF